MKQIFSILVFSFLLTSCFFHWDTGSSDESTQSSTPKTILALGDSLTAGYWVDASENYPTKLENILKENNYNYTVINAGVSWDTSAQVLARAWSKMTSCIWYARKYSWDCRYVWRDMNKGSDLRYGYIPYLWTWV